MATLACLASPLVRAETPEPAPRPAEAAVAPELPGLDVALRLQEAFAAVAERAFPSVVGVTGFVRGAAGEEAAGEGWTAPTADALLYPGFRRARSASGFVADEAGTILTAAAVLEADGGGTVDIVDVELADGSHELARIVGIEPTLGLGVLSVMQFGAAQAAMPPALAPADPHAARTGHWTIALGNPWGPGLTYAVGTLASPPERQCYQESMTATLIQASLDVPPAGHGGPLVDIHGRVLGVVLPGPPGAGASAAGGAQELALPIDLAMTVAGALLTAESRRSPWLGLAVRELASVRRELQRAGVTDRALPRTGVLIDDVYVPGPAAGAGIRPGDALVAIDGHRLFSVSDFQRRLYLSGIGRKIALEVWREGETLERRVTIEERPETAPPS